MNKIIALSATALAICAYATPGHAQATRTWVSGTGDDANPCGRTTPCKTFAGAISKTAAGGEISALDPAGFGAVTIAKAITINGDGTLAGILAASVNGVVVQAGTSDKVILRNISINGAGSGLSGVRFTSGAQLTLENITIDGFVNHGVDVSLTTSADLYLRNVRITKVNLHGVSLTSSGPFLVASLDNVSIMNPGSSGISQSGAGVGTTVTNSVIASAGNSGVAITTGAGFINVDSSSIINNATGFTASPSGSTIRISNNNIYGNLTGYTIGAGAFIASTGNNRAAGNGGGVPNAVLSVQ